MTDERFALALESDRDVVLRFCIRLTKHKQRGEDLLQETMFRAWRARESFDGRTTVKNWLMRIASRLHMDEIRKMNRRPCAEVDLSGAAQFAADSAPSVHELVQEEQVIAGVLGAIEREEGAEVMQMVRLLTVERWSWEEIGASYGLHPTTLKTRHHRALKRIRRAVAEARKRGDSCIRLHTAGESGRVDA